MMNDKNKVTVTADEKKENLSSGNLARRSTTISFGAIFVISVSIALLALISIYWFIEIRSGVEALNTYGYPSLTYEGEEVPYNSYQYERYYYYDLKNEYPEEYAKYESSTIDFDIKFNNDVFRNKMGTLWLIEIGVIIVAVLSFVLAVSKTGPKNEDGTIYLNRFDRILVELDIAALILATICLYPVFLFSLAWLNKSDYGKSIFLSLINNNPNADTIRTWMDFTFDVRQLDYAFEPRWILLVIAIVIALMISAINLVVFLSIVRKIKARKFWSSTIIGSIIYAVRYSVASSPGVKWKVLGTLSGGIILMAFAAILTVLAFGFNAVPIILVGALIMIVLVFILVPRELSKYEKIRTGISELQRGNFTYKVPDLGMGELGRLANSVNSISEAQDIAIQNELKSQRLRTDLISNVSHDIRTPLTSVISYVDLLKKERLTSPHAEEYLNIIIEKTNRLQKLTDDLFEAAKASSGDIPVTIEKLDMNAIVGQALAELDESINKNNIDVILTNHAESSMVYADGKLLWRVIENILTNVAKYSLNGTRAYMAIYDRGENIILEVKNLSKDQLNISPQELLERFKRGDSSRNTEGSGLGLAIASDLTALMGGNFEISIDGDLFKATVCLKKAEKEL